MAQGVRPSSSLTRRAICRRRTWRSQHALEKWKELGHSEQELFVAVHHMPDALESELASVEQRLIALLHPSSPTRRGFAQPLIK